MGLIPAHAGKTTHFVPEARAKRAHPRSRGENAGQIIEAFVGAGSSPLTRGKPAPGLALGRGPGLIPAHAGKTQTRPESRRPIGAHPRSRGENTTVSRPSITSGGSSPLTRGKRGAQASDGTQTGLIPAHAGKTHDMQHDVDDDWGSSPLTRGKRGAVDGGRDGLRLIPAHAGKTQATRRRHQRPRAHPRSRGENSVPFLTRIMDGGSSPLTRGKRTEVHEPPRRAGLIPAHAGKTCAGRQCP